METASSFLHSTISHKMWAVPLDPYFWTGFARIILKERGWKSKTWSNLFSHNDICREYDLHASENITKSGKTLIWSIRGKNGHKLFKRVGNYRKRQNRGCERSHLFTSRTLIWRLYYPPSDSFASTLQNQKRIWKMTSKSITQSYLLSFVWIVRERIDIQELKGKA